MSTWEARMSERAKARQSVTVEDEDAPDLELRAWWAKFCEDRGGFATSYDPMPLAQHAHAEAHGLGATFDAVTGEFSGSFSFIVPDDWDPPIPPPECLICRDYPRETSSTQLRAALEVLVRG